MIKQDSNQTKNNILHLADGAFILAPIYIPLRKEKIKNNIKIKVNRNKN